MAGDHGPQKPRNFSGPGPAVVERQKIAKERAAQRVRCWAVYDEVKGVVGWVSSTAAEKIFDSANPTEIGA